MKRIIKWLVLIIGVYVILHIGLLAKVAVTEGVWPWEADPAPPVPPFAQHFRTSYPTTGDARVTDYDTDQSLEVIQAFYRHALAPAGWHYRCTITALDPPCADAYSGNVTDRVEVFDRGLPGTVTWQTFSVRMTPDARSGLHTVSILQHLPTSYVAPPQPTVSSPDSQKLFGEWKATDPHARRDFILRFDDRGHVGVSVPTSGHMSPLEGTYHFDKTTLRLTFMTSSPRGNGLRQTCESIPSFLSDRCQAAKITADQKKPYPAPTVAGRSTPMLPAPTRLATLQNAYPLPTVSMIVESRIDATLTVALDNDTLILTHQSGLPQVFQRVRSES